MLTRQIGRLCPSFVLAQNPNDLLFREPATLHRPSLQQGRTLILRGGKTQWQVTGTQVRSPICTVSSLPFLIQRCTVLKDTPSLRAAFALLLRAKGCGFSGCCLVIRGVPPIRT